MCVLVAVGLLIVRVGPSAVCVGRVAVLCACRIAVRVGRSAVCVGLLVVRVRRCVHMDIQG